MNFNKWIKRLRREVTGNPKKGAALGLLLLVALYFWAPLVWQWIAADNPAAGASAFAVETKPPVGKTGGATAPAGGPSQGAAQPWQEVVRWMEADPRTMAAMDLAARRDPFRLVLAPRAAETEQEIEATHDAAPPRRVWTAEALGLQLSSTVVGPQRSLALISGRTYGLGQTIELSKDGDRIVLTLAQVAPGRVVLEGEGQSFELAIAQRRSSGRFEFMEDRD